MSKPPISVIIPVLNEEKTICRLISTLRKNETGYLKEILVVDGGSHDQTVELAVQSGARVIQPGIKGRAKQMNAGAAEAAGSVLFFLHADTIPPPGFDAAIVNALKMEADAGCFQLRFDLDHPALRFFGWCTRLRTTFVRFGDQGLFTDSELFEKAGGFSEELVVMEDQQMVRKLKRLGKFRLLDERVTTSARRYQRHGIFRLQLIFTLIWAGYYLGISQEALVHFYRSCLREKGI